MNRIKFILKAGAIAATVLMGAQAQAQTTNLGTFNTNLNPWNQPTGSTVTQTAFGTALFNSADDILFRNVAVVAGQAYSLSFDYLASSVGLALYLDFNNPGGPVEYVTADPGVAVNYTPASPFDVETGTYNFTALATGNTRLRFIGVNGNTTHLDNVSITAVPEPETYAMMLAGLGAVGFMARRRKFKQA